MALPADSPPLPVTPRTGRRLDRVRRTPRGRIALAILAAFTGIALLTAGIVQTTGGLSGTAPAIGASPSPSRATASPSQFAIASDLPVASPTTPSPGGSGGGVTPAEPRATALAAQLQATLEHVRAKLAVPGVSVTILFPDGSEWTGAGGLADVANRTPVTPATAFAFASMSKTFTSALILQLVAEGRLHLNDSAALFLPPLKKPIDRRITIAMLLDHTSGLHDFFLNPKIDKPLQSQPNRAWTTDEVLSYVGKRYFPPGRGWHYSNTNYLLLGLIAERITGAPLAAAIRTRLLEPAGLTTTWYQAAEKPRAALAHGYRLPGVKLTVRPIDLDDGSGIAPFRSVVTAAAGAGSLAGTSGDLARWARLLYSGEILGADGTAVLLGGFGATATYRPTVPYGYGVQAVVVDGHPSFGHSGRLLGFRGAVRHFPVDGLTIAVLTNQSRADPGVIVRALLAVAVPTAPTCPICLTAR
ncbi:MAG TPA: serine hydrolase domain-containing protein [Candidatus Limnocylindrales bacterium]|nr:serine hydrolase domain-containing protein [Candidatus Limnocylindrales bacterium]